MLSRRHFIEGSAALGLVAAFAPAALAQRRTQTETVDVAQLMQPGPLGDVWLGKADAPVTIVEYASLTCGHCASFHTGTLPELKKKYIETGKVRLVFREFALNQLDAAVYMLTRCALNADGKAGEGVDQARYFALIDVFFQQQRTWAFGGNPLEAVTAITRQAGMTQAQFEACLNNQAILDALNATRERAASAFGVESTPTFFVNGKRVLGAQPAAEFEKIIDPLLPA
ncbi:DsbA family protein [Phreatobacter cathodiphilus]|uniref:Disulfide bond formation protein DsbA n=1 Tax=Phreatobacter cathodiphilus TaxID=1868589 RepID=A0A2S0NFG3_9HYPH|nr:DsbA family protein [Phreatobacter cathodiphilus]AVO46895.1 disulfide bond formation protein DsbA [Phreatobacter cathodiphilus]